MQVKRKRCRNPRGKVRGIHSQQCLGALPHGSNGHRCAAGKEGNLGKRAPSVQAHGTDAAHHRSDSICPEQRHNRQDHRMQPENEYSLVLHGRVRHGTCQY